MTELFFEYELPPHLIAQYPKPQRDASRLLVIHRATGTISHHVFNELPMLLRPHDLIILNDTKVFPARVVGRRTRTGGKWEGLFIREAEQGLWELRCKSRGYPKPGETFVLNTDQEPEQQLTLTLRERTAERHWLMSVERNEPATELLMQYGHIPLPHYIRHGEDELEDKERYQTVFARQVGSVAAPTAGLHFTPELFNELTKQAVKTASVTLHVGLGTFAPVKATDPRDHVIHGEWADVNDETVRTIKHAIAVGGRVVAVGTTATRALETAARRQPSGLQPFRAETNLFIHPPFEFKVVDALITNFHLPKTSLLLLAGAFTGVDLLRQAYQEAIREEYRFFSYGDAMLVL